MEQSFDPDAVQAAALIDATSSDPSGKSLDRSISHLEMLTRASSPSAWVYTDLSAARLAGASRRDDARLLFGALDAACHALELDPANAAALYNRALSADLLALDADASRTWRSYLAHDSTSIYAEEARARLRAMARRPSITAPDSSAAPAEFAEFAERAPAEARALVLEKLLPAWGDAVLASDSPRARSRLDAARAASEVVARRVRDWSASDAVAAIDRAGDRDRRQLAVLHATFGRSQRFAQQSNYPPADSGFRAILASHSASASLRTLASYGHALALLNQQHPADVLRIADSLIHVVPAARYPGVLARTQWLRALVLLRALKTDEGLDAVHQASALYARVGQYDDVASAIGVEGETRLQNGSSALGYQYVHRAAVALRYSPISLWRHNSLVVLARATTRAGLPCATRIIEAEDAGVVAGGPRLTSVVEAALARARSEWIAEHAEASNSALDEATRALAKIPPGVGHSQLQREVDLTLAQRLLRERPDSARALLDSVVAFFQPLNFPMKLIPALLMRSSIGLSRGDSARARADLEAAATTYVNARAAMASAAQTAALNAQAKSVFDQLMLLQINAAHPNEALRTLSTGRALFSRLSRGVSAAAQRGATITYALVGDTLLSWVVTSGDTFFVRSTVNATQTTRTVERVRSMMELGAPEQALRADLERLYVMLLAPVANRIGAQDDVLAISADGALANIPFGALHDPKTGQYLVERYAIRFAPPGGSAPIVSQRRAHGVHAVIVSNPSLDARTFPQLPPLGHADTEAATIARLYPSAAVIGGTRADSASVVNGLASATVFHFAGHAVFDDVEPERSYLALGQRGLTPATISTLELGRLDLVVLSACETLRSSQTSDGGFLGLAESFLVAGARGVVGSAWRVDDEASSRLMGVLHRAYRSGADGVVALRQAQLDMLHAGGSPSDWAAFVYTGS